MMQDIYFFNNKTYKLFLNSNKESRYEITDKVLVIPIYNNSFVMVYQPKTKLWEFPQGKFYINESIIEDVEKIVFETTGAIVKNLELIGYYTLNKSETDKTNIYISKVIKFDVKPKDCEVGLVKLFDDLPDNTSFNKKIFNIIMNKNNFKRGR